MSRNAILLFSKVPEAGKVKTRLTPLKDGRLAPEHASYLYHCMLFDVVEICCDAASDLKQTNPSNDYDIIISSPGKQQEQMKALFTESGSWPASLQFIADVGASFDEHYNNSFEQVWNMGYDTILSMGCDMPALSRPIVVEGFKRLEELLTYEKGGIVLSPDQQMGVSIVGWTRHTDFNHTGVFYNKDGLTVLPAYIQKADTLNLPALYLPAVPDVDTMMDLYHSVTVVQALEYCSRFQSDLTSPHRTADALRWLGFKDIRVAPNDLFDAREEIDLNE